MSHTCLKELTFADDAVSIWMRLFIGVPSLEKPISSEPFWRAKHLLQKYVCDLHLLLIKQLSVSTCIAM
jgi:hypothetical protein